MSNDLNKKAASLRKALAKVNEQRKAQGLLGARGHKTEEHISIVLPLLRKGKTVKEASDILREKTGMKPQSSGYIANIVNITMQALKVKAQPEAQPEQ